MLTALTQTAPVISRHQLDVAVLALFLGLAAVFVVVMVASVLVVLLKGGDR